MEVILWLEKNKEFYNVLILIVLLSIIITLPKQFWTNLFFIALILIEVTLLLILSYFWIQKNKDICTDRKNLQTLN